MATLEQMKRDNDKRIPLKFDQYSTLRNMFGVLTILIHVNDTMKDRIAVLPYGKRDMAMIIAQYQKLLQNLVYTTPGDRLTALKNELDHTHMEVKTTKPKASRLCNGVSYVPTQALERVIEHALSMECFTCEKCGRDVLNCQLRKDIQQMYHYDFPSDWKNGCPLSYGLPMKGEIDDDAGTAVG